MAPSTTSPHDSFEHNHNNNNNNTSSPSSSPQPDGSSSNKQWEEGEGGEGEGRLEDGTNGFGPGGPKPHLSEEQKKANHIASEKKRRNNIRDQYDKLAAMTPGMEGQGRSEGKVLEEVVKHGRELRRERERLIEQIEARGGVVGEELRNF